MKLSTKISLLITLNTSILLHTNTQNINFELVNKSPNTIFATYGDSTYPALNTKASDISLIKPNEYVFGLVDPKKGLEILILDNKFLGAGRGTKIPAALYVFNALKTGNKTFYLQFTEKGLEPQTGSILKFGNTTRGYSLKNNITQEDLKINTRLIPVEYTKL